MSFFTTDEIKKVLKSYNDELHFRLENTNDRVFLVSHNLADPRKFRIIKDSYYDNKKLEGYELVFDNPDDFKQAFPEFSQPPPIHVPSNMQRNKDTGTLEGKHKDPYIIQKVTAMEGGKFLIDLGENKEIGTLWIQWNEGNKKQYKFTVAALQHGNDNDNNEFIIIPHLKDVYSKGKALTPEPYNLSENEMDAILARYLIVITDAESPKFVVTKAISLVSMEQKKKSNAK